MNVHRLSAPLRHTALVLALSSLGLWFGTGSHTGWTQTSVLEFRHDEITGIEYPVRRDAFVAGLELLGAGLGAAAGLGGLGVALRRRRTVTV